jgi:hypothetical protein
MRSGTSGTSGEQNAFFLLRGEAAEKYQFTVLIVLIVLLKNSELLSYIIAKALWGICFREIVTILATNQGKNRGKLTDTDHFYTEGKTVK